MPGTKRSMSNYSLGRNVLSYILPGTGFFDGDETAEAKRPRFRYIFYNIALIFDLIEI